MELISMTDALEMQCFGEFSNGKTLSIDEESLIDIRAYIHHLPHDHRRSRDHFDVRIIDWLRKNCSSWVLMLTREICLSYEDAWYFLEFLEELDRSMQ